MDLYPSHIGDRLGLRAVLDRLESLAGSDDGRALARSGGTRAHADSRAELDVVSALQEVRRAGSSLPEVDFDDVSRSIAEARPAGAFLDPDALLDILRLARTVERVVGFLNGTGQAILASEATDLVLTPDLVRAIESVVDRDGQIRDDASEELKRIRRARADAQATVRKALMAALRRASGEGWAAEDQPTLRGGRMVIPVRSEAKRKLNGIVHDVSATGQTAFVEPADCVELNNQVREFEAEERREIVRLLTAVTDVVRSCAEALSTNQEALAGFDVRRAKALLADSWDGVVPESGDEGVIQLLDARNPELLLRGNPDEVVPLSLAIGTDAGVLVISGPNAGGKSVAMKTVGLMACLLAMGIPVPADSRSRFDRLDRLMADIGDEQSVEDDLSTFSSRLERSRAMLEGADRRTLVLIDEAGTGTDPQEGAALAQAMLESLHARGARVIVTTHHAALKRFAHDLEGARNAMMRFDEQSLSPTYVFEAGLPGASYAFEIADRMGLPADVVRRARDVAGADRVSLETLLVDLEARNRELQERIDEQTREADRARRQREVLDVRLEALTRAREEIRGKAIEEAEVILQAANREVERAVREIRESKAAPDTVREARARLEERKSDVDRRKRKATRRLKAREEPPQSPSAPVGVGDRVSVGPGGPAGEVLELKDGEAVVAIGPAHTRVRTDRLIRVGGPTPQRVSVTAPSVDSTAASIRLDVRGSRALEAVSQVERFVDQAMAGGLNRIEILHGKGTGALRGAIQEYLEGRRDIAAHEEAPIQQGGAGITVVFL